MTTFLAANLTLLLFTVIVGVLQCTHRHEAGMPHAPLGADPERDADLSRVLHDLAVHP